MASLLGAYTSLLSRRPMLGNIATSAVLFATGDVIAQQLIEKRGKDHDLTRTGRIVLWGGGLFAPAVTVWFRTLERIRFRNAFATTAARVGLDQFVFAPCVLSAFFTVMTKLEGKGWADVEKKWKADFVPTLQTNWMVWIPFQAINMGLIPPHLRVLAVNGVNIPWNAFLSLQANKGKSDVVKVEVDPQDGLKGGVERKLRV